MDIFKNVQNGKVKKSFEKNVFVSKSEKIYVKKCKNIGMWDGVNKKTKG